MNTPQSLLIRPALALAALLLTAVTFDAHAAGAPAGATQAVVRYGDLDLATPAGAEALYRRIAAAAASVCPQADARELDRARDARACREAAIERAVGQVGHAQLAAVKAGRGKRGRAG